MNGSKNLGFILALCGAAAAAVVVIVLLSSGFNSQPTAVQSVQTVASASLPSASEQIRGTMSPTAESTQSADQTVSPNIEFTINNYDVQASVSLDNVYDITETITANFSNNAHGIRREISLTPKITQKASDGSDLVTTPTVSVSDIKVEGYPFTTETIEDASGKTEVIKIGDPGKTITGTQIYKISYKLHLGDDQISQFDEVYYNIIGTGWDVPIEHASFSITLPNKFDPGQVDFYVGSEGTSGFNKDALNYQINGKVISGSILKPLAPNMGVKIRVLLPEGYFNAPQTTFGSKAYIKNPVLTDQVDPNGKPGDRQTVFALNKPVYASVELYNAPKNTKLTFKWYENDTYLGPVILTNNLPDQYMVSYNTGFKKTGSYTVKIFIDDREKPEAVLQFKVQ